MDSVRIGGVDRSNKIELYTPRSMLTMKAYFVCTKGGQCTARIRRTRSKTGAGADGVRAGEPNAGV